MAIKVLIVEDQFIEANNLEMMLEKAGYTVCGIAKSVSEALRIIEKEQPDLALVDIQLKGALSGIDLAVTLREKNIAFIYISANSNQGTLMKAKATQPYGFIVKPFRERDLMVTLEIAQYRHEHSLESALKKEEQLLRSLQVIVQMKGTKSDKMHQIPKIIQSFLTFDYFAICTNMGLTTGDLMSYLRIGFGEYQFIGLEEFHNITACELSDINKFQDAEANIEKSIFNGEEFKEMIRRFGLRKLIADKFSMKSLIVLPIRTPGDTYLSFYFYSRREDAYDSGHIALLERLSNTIYSVIRNILELDSHDTIEITTPSKTVKSKNKEVVTGFEDIIGNSHLLLNAFDNVLQVAPVDTSVLILGDSGTGKERIAHSIHELSGRQGHPFIKINCASLPANLIESELFGHEKGAFTGAVDRHIGKFERANKGTIFLDEIGDMPYELQAKLLRVLQEKEIERIAGTSPIKVDVRVISATNRNLEKEIAAGRFRLDLYYRLNIFPITLPALRERKEDIPLLIDHFINKFNLKIGKHITGILPRGLQEAMTYDWPGNIRELENLVERAMLVTKDIIIKRLAIPELHHQESTSLDSPINGFKSIGDNEREHILKALGICKGKIWGTGGAAELLNLPPSTLNSKIKKLGIKRGFN